jgi:hypothetical protein
MPVPTFDELQDPGMEMSRLARERLGGGYDSNTYDGGEPISLKDLSNLSGGNAGGSEKSFPAINMFNIYSANFFRNRRPDGSNPLGMGEFFGYNQTLTRTQVRFAYSSSSGTTACSFTMQSTIYYHDGSNTIPVDGDRMYTTYNGFTPAPAGFYQLFDPSTGISEGTYAEVLGGGGGFAGTIIGVSSC